MTKKKVFHSLFYSLFISALLFVLFIGAASQFDGDRVFIDKVSNDIRWQDNNENDDDDIYSFGYSLNILSTTELNYCSSCYLLPRIYDNVILRPEPRAPPHFS